MDKKEIDVYEYIYARPISEQNKIFLCRKVRVIECEKTFCAVKETKFYEKFYNYKRRIEKDLYLDKIVEEKYYTSYEIGECFMVVREDTEENRKKFKKMVLDKLCEYSNEIDKLKQENMAEQEKIAKQL